MNICTTFGLKTLLIRVILWERVRSWYGKSVLSGRCGWRTWLVLVFTRWKKVIFSRVEQFFVLRQHRHSLYHNMLCFLLLQYRYIDISLSVCYMFGVWLWCDVLRLSNAIRSILDRSCSKFQPRIICVFGRKFSDEQNFRTDWNLRQGGGQLPQPPATTPLAIAQPSSVGQDNPH